MIRIPGSPATSSAVLPPKIFARHLGPVVEQNVSPLLIDQFQPFFDGRILGQSPVRRQRLFERRDLRANFLVATCPPAYRPPLQQALRPLLPDRDETRRVPPGRHDRFACRTGTACPTTRGTSAGVRSAPVSGTLRFMSQYAPLGGGESSVPIRARSTGICNRLRIGGQSGEQHFHVMHAVFNRQHVDQVDRLGIDRLGQRLGLDSVVERNAGCAAYFRQASIAPRRIGQPRSQRRQSPARSSASRRPAPPAPRDCSSPCASSRACDRLIASL